jgi:hypothetical protein
VRCSCVLLPEVWGVTGAQNSAGKTILPVP